MNLIKTVALSLLIGYTLGSYSCIRTRFCDFHKNVASCNGLPYIPPLPKSVTTLHVKCSFFPNLTRETFKNVSANRIKELIIMKNSFTYISGSALFDFDKLVTLEISYEPGLNVTSVRDSLMNLNTKNLGKLRLIANQWTTLPNNFFNRLYESPVESIYLDLNEFIQFNTAVLKHFKTKQLLFSCDRCGITSITTGLSPVKYLRIPGNNIHDDQKICGRNNSELALNLESLDLTANTLTSINSDSFKCFCNLRKLVLDGNPITSLKSRVFINMLKLDVLSISNTPNLKILNPAAFASNSLRILRFRECRFRFDRSRYYHPGDVFSDIPKLSDINLSNNYLPHRDVNMLKLFSHLKNLKKLRLTSTGISRLPNGFLKKMKHLQLLDLQGNKIEEWTPDTFSYSKNLTTLYLNGNLIRVINSTSFPESLLKSMKRIELSDNPFTCTCQLKWFLDLLQSKDFSEKLPSWPYRYHCAAPQERKYVFLSKYYPSAEECNPLRIFNIIAISVCSVLIAVFIIIIATIKCQVNLRNMVYLLRSRMLLKKGYMHIPAGGDFKYHVFIVYCGEDRFWVHNTLLTKLENAGIKVCVHHRDFTVGTPITDNISECMDNSWKIIVVLSNDFTKSEWCQWELDLVHERKRRSGNEALIVIMYKEVNSSHMTRCLRTLLMTSPFMIYKKGLGEQLFWTAVIKSIHTPLKLPPKSIL